MLEQHYAGRLDHADRELARALELRHDCGTQRSLVRALQMLTLPDLRVYW
jgi:hypothetical protein